jgi:uncharacterized repeat protein (TIGR03803 family)
MKLTSLLRTAAIMAVLSVLSQPLLQTVQAQTETVLYNFCSVGGVIVCDDGEYPIGPLAVGPDTTFFGTSATGGASCANGGTCSGTVFGLEPEPSGGCEGVNPGNGWCEFVLYNFCSVANCADGSEPRGGVSYLNAHFSRPGNLYGTTYSGGIHNAGVVFEISSKPTLSGCPAGSNQSGGWCETVLYNFCSFTVGNICEDGNNPFGNLVEDSSGNLYGTVKNGVFELSPNQQGGWDSELIYADNFVIGGLAIDSSDNLYGVDVDGILDVANVFKISLSQATDPHKNIYTFNNKSKNGFPNGPPAVDGAGNVYGTTFGTTGGDIRPGTVWKLTPVTTGEKAGTYTMKDLHTFTAEKNGLNPGGGVLLDSAGNIYSTTTYGGNTECQIGPGCGTIFELAADGDTYKYKVLWRFTGTDGANPYYPPFLNSAGNFYGVTSIGGANNLGTMYQVTP